MVWSLLNLEFQVGPRGQIFRLQKITVQLPKLLLGRMRLVFDDSSYVTHYQCEMWQDDLVFQFINGIIKSLRGVTHCECVSLTDAVNFSNYTASVMAELMRMELWWNKSKG